jgi:2,3-diketo-5-methylthio-1-phosphopentane phosphatase
MRSSRKVLVVFDFDWSLINENSDTWVFDKLNPKLRAELSVLNSVEYRDRWTALMDHLVGRLTESQEITQQQLRDCLCAVPIFPEVLLAIQLAAQSGAELAILSDANSFYISTILSHHNISHLFTRIATNFGEFCEGGSHCSSVSFDHQPRCHIRPFHCTERPHTCSRCPINLCKGSVLDEWLGSGHYDHIYYVGDGQGDICPSLRLRNCDTLLCRQDFSMHKSFSSDKRIQDELQCKFLLWENGLDLLRCFNECFQE